MAVLRVSKNNQLTQEQNLEEGQTYLAGRGENCQIRLDPEPGISRNHFQLSFESGSWQMRVLSRYGEIYMDGHKVTDFALQAGTLFSVPPYSFEFAEGSVAVAQGTGAHEATVISVLPSSAYLRIVDDRGIDKQMFRLEGDTWTIGRDASCAIHLEYPKCSRKHCEVYRESENYFIRDLGSANGTSVNGHPLSKEEWTRLQSGDTITVIEWILKFEVRDPTFKDRIEAVPQDLKNPTLHEEYVEPSQVTSASQFSSAVPNLESTRIENVPMPPPVPGTWQDVQPNPNDGYQEPQQDPQSEPVYNMVDGAPEGELPPDALFASQKKKMNPVRWVIVALIVGGAFFYFMSGDESSPTKETSKQGKSKSPFDALSPEDQQFVRRAYENAKQNLINHRYTEALQEITRMKEKIPVYEDSAEVEKYANEGILRLEQIKSEDAKAQKDQEMESQIQKQVALCKAQINPKTWDVARLDSCLSSVLALNPEHPAFQALRAQVTGYVQARDAQKASQHQTALEVSKLRALYEKAHKLLDRNKMYDGIEALQLVIDSKLRDPEGLKAKAKAEKEVLVSQMEVRQKELEAKGDSMMKENRYKEAVIALRQALDINPDNEMVKSHLHAALLELKKLMQPIYQESIVEESVGDVEKAKERWKKIIENSLTGEEYYEKSRLKMKKYGLL
jgi:pSer/pThr/pTyr-binding forkhead associated (FHA) protein/tetratricopeptide (TPR) repeat protein